MAKKLVTLVTEGATNYIVLPNGQKRNLGTISPLKLICVFYTNKREARQLLDRLLAESSVMMRVDTDSLDTLFEAKRRETYPYRRSQWASLEGTISPLMETKICGGSAMLDSVEQIVRKIEARTSHFNSRVASGDEVTGADVEGFKGLVEELKAEVPKGQSKNDYFSKDKKKEASVEAQLDVAIDRISATRKVIDRLEADGRKFNASRARADLLDAADKVRNLLARETISDEDAQVVVDRVNKLHGLFAGAK